MPTSICLFGARGRMGREITSLLELSKSYTLIGSTAGVGDDVEKALIGADVAIDFSTAKATKAHVRACVLKKMPLLIGATGQSAEEMATIEEASKEIPILLAPNTSLGASALENAAKTVAKLIGKDMDVDIIEHHHAKKLDSPSGTALHLKNGLYPLVKKEVTIHSLRSGSGHADHTIIFSLDGETVELTHRAKNRTLFAKGALEAASWLAKQKKGLYTMSQYLEGSRS